MFFNILQQTSKKNDLFFYAAMITRRLISFAINNNFSHHVEWEKTEKRFYNPRLRALSVIAYFTTSGSVKSTNPNLLRLVRLNGKATHPGMQSRRGVLHPFYLAPYAEYPLLLGFGLQPLMVANVNYMHGGFLGLVAEPTLMLLAACALWWVRDLVQMGTHAATYDAVVRRNLQCGVLLFIISEVMVFFGLFWAYFHTSLNPAAELGGVWPPAELPVLDWYRWPTLSTALLVYSGFSANATYYALKGLLRPRHTLATSAALGVSKWFGSDCQRQRETLLFGAAPFAVNALRGVASLRLRRLRRGLALLYGGLCYTIFTGSLFLLCQRHEYGHAVFTMADGAYASVFYGLTGLHGLHVLAGLLLLLTVLAKLLGGSFDRDANPHVIFTAALWYWHFVDLVWIFLYLSVYLWGNAHGADSADALAAAGLPYLLGLRRGSAQDRTWGNLPQHQLPHHQYPVEELTRHRFNLVEVLTDYCGPSAARVALEGPILLESTQAWCKLKIGRSLSDADPSIPVYAGQSSAWLKRVPLNSSI